MSVYSIAQFARAQVEYCNKPLSFVAGLLIQLWLSTNRAKHLLMRCYSVLQNGESCWFYRILLKYSLEIVDSASGFGSPSFLKNEQKIKNAFIWSAVHHYRVLKLCIFNETK